MRRHSQLFVRSVLVALSTSTLVAADLRDATSQAHEQYVHRAQDSFLRRLNEPPGGSQSGRAELAAGQTLVQPGEGDGILNIPGGLTHHWRAAIFIPGVTLDEVVNLSRSYREYPDIFHPVIGATVLADEGTSLRVQFRLRESAGGMTATLDVRSNITYARPDASHAYSISRSDEIRQVEDAGRPTERRLPAGRDSGYLWRASAFTKFVADPGGVYMEMETVGLSRPFPPLLGWLIEPVARRVGRGSVEESVEEFRRAALMRHASPPQHPPSKSV
jgi:hypothetical protein